MMKTAAIPSGFRIFPAEDMVVPVTVFPDIVSNEMNNRRVKTNCTIPLWLKAKAEGQGINFFQVLEASLRDMLS